MWRHGRTQWNLERRFQGQTDVPLDEDGRAQAERSARLLAALEPDLIVSSDLQRAADTAQELARIAGLPVSYEPGLRETYGGRWQGLTIEEIDERYPHEVAAWRRGEQIRRGGGELEAEVADRMVEVIERRLDDLPDKDGTLVVVTHGGAARVAIGRLLGLGPSTWWVLGPLSNCCWTVLGENQRGWRLLEHNAGTLPEPVLGDDR